MELQHYNKILKQTLGDMGYDVAFQPCCLMMPYDGTCWTIRYPNVKWRPNTRVIMHCQDFVSIDMTNNTCPELDVIEKYFGDNADKVIIIHWNIDLEKLYDGPMTLLYFPTHSYELLINLNKSFDQWNSLLTKPRSKIWQCLNGVTRKQRRLVARYLQEFYSNGILSLGNDIPLAEWNYETYFGCNNELNWTRLLPVYGDCDINIVTETQYYQSPGIITEKTLMAFLGLQVPILIGYPGIITHCQQLGFDMFRDIVNTDYEFASDDVRWKQAIDLNSGLLTNGIDRDSLHTRLLNNQKHARALPKKLVRDFSNKVLATFQDLRKDAPS